MFRITKIISIAILTITWISGNEMVYAQDPAGDSVTIDPETLPPYQRDRYGDPFSGYESPSPFLIKPPSSLDIGIDSTGAYYNISEKIGPYNYRTESTIPFEEYQEYKYREMVRDYWKTISSAQDGGDDLTGEGLAIPPIKLGRLAQRLFGGDQVTIQPNGQVVLDFGGLWQRVNNPGLPIRQQKNGGFNFDQQIGMALSGKIGEKLSVNANFDTKNTFQFEQKYNINYTAFEEDIIQEVQLGNVSFSSRNSLISGAQNLFGFTTKMRFGKLFIDAVVSNQRGSTETMVIKNGAQNREFEIRADMYDANRNFFLAQFFRNNYEASLNNIPVINSGVTITRMELYITNRNNDTQTLRSVTGFLDLGEAYPYDPQWRNDEIPITGPPIPADNDINKLFEKLQENPSLRVSDATSQELEILGLEKGTEFETLRSARKLNQDEYYFHPQLGYISLRTPLKPDEVLAVSFEYTYRGQSFKVGELSEDYQNLTDDKTIFLKLLRPSSIRIDLPTWDLMMKNVYSLNTNLVVRDNFQFKVVYRDDFNRLDKTSLNEGRRIKDIPLVNIMGLDRLNQSNEIVFEVDPDTQERTVIGDGNFDYVEDVTINTRDGKVIFPVLEPFGKHLEKFFDEDEGLLKEQYVFDTLYRGTQNDATQTAGQNKYFMTGSYQSGTSNEIILPGINIAENSVVIRAGNTVLSEGVDFTVDYQFGRVRILNEGVLNSAKEIRIQYERADLFSFRQKSLMGFDAEYRLTKDIRFTGTFLHLNERPTITRVAVGNEPTRNTMWGFGVDYRSDSRLLTKMVDALPFISTKEQSSVALKAEFAQIVPGVPSLLVGDKGTSYIDDFEQAEVPYDLTRSPTSWVLGSTPQAILNDQVASAGLEKNYRRAKLAWYTIDNSFYSNTNNIIGVTEEIQENHYMRYIPFDEVFPNKQRGQVALPEISFDLAYYPEEIGPYNYNPDLDPDGSLKNPSNNFGAVTRAITSDIDFDNSNIQYIEFWLMDPFDQDRAITGAEGNTGGKLVFNLGNISEDLIPDERHFFENGLPVTDEETADTTVWGKVPNTQYLTNSFAVGPNARTLQDVGFDGLLSSGGADTNEEAIKRADYLEQLRQNGVSPEIVQRIAEDPSADDFKYYLDPSYDETASNILERYKAFNGPEGNSPENAGSNFTPSSSTFPDNEDLNRDNTLSDIEQYFEYEVPLDQEGNRLKISDNPYVVDQVDAVTEEGKAISWYQFRIPLRDKRATAVNNIQSFKSIKFLRMYMTGWTDPVVLRMVQFQFVGAQWRPFTEELFEPGLDEVPDNDQTFLAVSSVNIEENGQDKNDGNSVAYNLPPGFNRDLDITSTITRALNEQSVQVKVDNLLPKDSRAIFKPFSLDLVNYKRLKMEIHAHDETRTTNEGDLTAFIRLGSDFNQNYYQIEVPLEMTPLGTSASDREALWPRSNEIDIALEELYKLKSERNRVGGDSKNEYPITPGPNIGKYRVTVRGNPELSGVQTVMLGVKNPRTGDGLPKSAIVWFNELRVTDFDQTSGWATNLSLNTKLADFAMVNASLRYNTYGFGQIQDKVFERARSKTLSYDVNANINLDKILLNKVGISLPLYVAYEKSITDPFFDPRDEDVPLELALASINDPQERQDYLDKVRDLYEVRSINLTNVRKKKMREDAKSNVWDIENLSFSASYSDAFTRNIQIATMLDRQWRLGAVYGFNSKAKPFEPFKNAEGLSSPWLKLVKDFNLNLVPTSIAIRADLRRNFRKIQYRNTDLSPIIPTYEKVFNFDRAYTLNWGLSKNLGLNYNAVANALIDENPGEITESVRDQIISNLKDFGRMKLFTQSVGANYKIPFDKIPLTSWLAGDASYNTTYTWTAGSLGIADTLGNNAANNRTIAVNGRIDMNKIYNSVPGLKKYNVTTGRGRGRQQDPLQLERKKLQDKLRKIDEKIKKQEEKAAQKETKRLLKLVDGDSTLLDSIRSVQPLEEEPAEEVKPKGLEKKKLRIQQQIADIDAEIERKKQAEEKPKEQKVIKGLAGLLMSVKSIKASFNESAGTILPGYMRTPKYFGFDDQWDSPGIDFLLGSQDANVRKEAAAKGYLSESLYQNNPFLQNRLRNLTFNADVEPVKDFKITLEAKKSVTDNYSENYRKAYDDELMDTVYMSQTPVRSGGFAMSYFMLPTAFSKDDINNNSELFDQFVANREVVYERLGLAGISDTLDLNNPDVLIPAFRMAYAGEDENTSNLSKFPKIPLPNWRVTYNGLSKVAGLKEVFRSVSITHGYSSEYAVGNFASSLFYVNDADLLTLNNDIENINSTQINPETGRIAPILVMSQVRMTEQFSPLIGVNLRTRSNVTIKVDYKTRRDVALNLNNAEVSELKNKDFTVDLGMTKAGMKLPIRTRTGSQIVLNNDVTMRLAMTIRDTKTVQRKIDDAPVVTQGNLNFQFKPTVAYQINKQANIQLYFERTINDPRVSSSYKRTTTAFGVQIRYALTQ